MLLCQTKYNLFMKTLFIIILLMLSGISLFSQYDNDLSLEKPIININDPNGGFYSEYSADDFYSMYCSAIVRNAGTSDATNVYLKVSLYDHSDNLIGTYFSDSISLIPSGQTDTIQVFGFDTQPSGSMTVIYSVESDFVDENQSNNIDTLPNIHFYYHDWIFISRSITPNDSINIREIEGFQSGDFIGIRAKTYGQHWVSSIELHCFDVSPNNVVVNGMIYQDENLLSSVQANIYPFYLDATVNHLTYMDQEYIYGFQFQFESADDFYIHVDTANYHNFQYETVAFIGGEWTTLNFVPVIRLTFDPEKIEKTDLDQDLNVSPNPITDYLYISGSDNIESLEVFNIGGNKVMTVNNELTEKKIDLTDLTTGIYIIRIKTPDGICVRKITKI